MRIALVDTNKKAAIYPVGLLKIGAWRKSLGDKCTLFDNTLPARGKFDQIWLSTTFTYDIQHALGMAIAAKKRAKKVKVGGVSSTLVPEPFEKHRIKVHIGLIPSAEKFSPDYSLLPKPPKYSIAHTSRGCVRKCEWCMVPVIEGKFVNRPGWIKDLHPEAKRIVFFDNNWLAKKNDELKADVKAIMALVEKKQIKSIDFNQGLDPRLVTEKKADLIGKLPIDPIRFAFDGMHEDGFYQDAVRRMFKRGHKHFYTLALYNFRDTPAEIYYRCKESAILTDELGQSAVRVSTCPMRFHPIKEAHLKRDYVGVHWTKKERNAFMRIVSCHNPHAAISCHGGSEGWTSVEEFEYWFGKNAKEFVRLLNYPKLRALVESKGVALRILRAQARIAAEKKKKKKGKAHV